MLVGVGCSGCFILEDAICDVLGEGSSCLSGNRDYYSDTYYGYGYGYGPEDASSNQDLPACNNPRKMCIRFDGSYWKSGNVSTYCSEWAAEGLPFALRDSGCPDDAISKCSNVLLLENSYGQLISDSKATIYFYSDWNGNNPQSICDTLGGTFSSM